MTSIKPTVRATNVDYYIPQPELPASQAITKDDAPKLFQPLTIRGITLPNRMGVSPMCTYSTDDKGEVTPFHLVHYGGFATTGAGLIIVEAASIAKEGGISKHDVSIWNDAQATKLKAVVDFAHTQKQLIGIQIGHAGRKSSARPPWEALETALPKEEGGWPETVYGPSPIEFRPYGSLYKPVELTNAGVKKLVKQFGEAAKRAVDIAGFDFLEIHGAHGYLINSFLSETSNKRTDEYGGSFENRTRFLTDIVKEIRASIPTTTPVFLRISATEGVDEPGAWTIDDSIKLVDVVVELGVDVIDVSSSGNNYKQRSREEQPNFRYPGIFHESLATAIKKSIGDRALVACVGGLGQSAIVTNSLLEEGAFDIALIGRAYLKNNSLTWQFADDLGVKTNLSLQYARAAGTDRSQITELIRRSEELTLKEQKV